MANTAAVSILPRTGAGTGFEATLLTATMATTITSATAMTPQLVLSSLMATTIVSVWTMSFLKWINVTMPTVITSVWSWLGGLTIYATMPTVITINAGVPLWSTGGDAWAVNWDTQASSRYESFPFNSYALVGARYYGAQADGIYLLGADTDNGAAIQASMSVGMQRMGTDSVKRLVMVYAEAASADKLQLKVSYSNAKGAQEYIYAADADGDFKHHQRFVVGRGIKASYMTFEVFNLNGCDFSLNKLVILSDDTGRRI